MSELGEVVIGDDVVFAVRLKKGKKTFTISSGATVTASLISLDKSVIYIDDTDQPETNEGSDWVNSLPVIEFTEAETTTITVADGTGALLEIQVADPKKTSWFIPVTIVKGTIA